MSDATISDFFSNLRDRCITVKEDVQFDLSFIPRFKEKADIGFCCYTKDDTERAYLSGKLPLTWGSYDMDEMLYLIVANAIVDEAQACSLKVTWNGSMHEKIYLEELDTSYFAEKLVEEESDFSLDSNPDTDTASIIIVEE